MSIVGPIEFISEVLRNPEDGKPFQLYPEQEQFLRMALTLDPNGRLPFSELVYSTKKKGGKTTTAELATIYVPFVLGGPYAEAFCCANDLEQSTGRVFQGCARIIEASPMLRKDCRITGTKIEYVPTGATIQAIASDYGGAAGSNPNWIVFDELWGFMSENAHRLWDEMVPPPTRTVTARMTVTYAGFKGESDLLWTLYQRGLKGEEIARDLFRQPGMLMLWTGRNVAPWQTDTWIEEMRQSLRPNAFRRMILNEWVSSESGFVDMDWWDACVDPAVRPVILDESLQIHVGVDASTKHDHTAIVAVTWDREIKRARLVFHRIFKPTPENPLDFEATVEACLRDLAMRFRVRSVRFDPWQMQAVAQRLRSSSLPMIEFPQTPSNLTEASQNLYELIKGRNLIVYPDDEIRLAISHAVAIEGARGWRITKEKASHKIDVVVALAQAAVGAVGSQLQRQHGGYGTLVGF